MIHVPDKPNPAFGGPGPVRNAWPAIALNSYPYRLALATNCNALPPVAFDCEGGLLATVRGAMA